MAGTHLPIPEGRKAELAWMAGYVVKQFTCPKAVTHPTILTGFNVEQLRWSRPTRYRYTKPPRRKPEIDGQTLQRLQYSVVVHITRDYMYICQCMLLLTVSWGRSLDRRCSPWSCALFCAVRESIPAHISTASDWLTVHIYVPNIVLHFISVNLVFSDIFGLPSFVTVAGNCLFQANFLAV